jgi:hypothetical protein
MFYCHFDYGSCFMEFKVETDALEFFQQLKSAWVGRNDELISALCDRFVNPALALAVLRNVIYSPSISPELEAQIDHWNFTAELGEDGSVSLWSMPCSQHQEGEWNRICILSRKKEVRNNFFPNWKRTLSPAAEKTLAEETPSGCNIL